MINNKRILITGGGGFIGTSLAEHLVDNNEVILLDKNFEMNAFVFSDLSHHKNIRLFKADILNVDDINKIVQEVNLIVHMSAMVGVQEVLHNSLETLNVNYQGTNNLLEAASKNTRCERFIFFSTSEIFGTNAFRIGENGTSTLSSIQDIRWCYSISKLAAEHLSFSYYREKSVPVVAVRPFNVFGPKRIGDHVILRFIIKALRGESVEVHGDGNQIRAWCYIDDFCTAVLRTMEVPEAVGQAYNIGNARNTMTIYELAKKIVTLCNSSSNIVFKAPDFIDIDIRVPNTLKAEAILQFEAETDIDEGLFKTIQWVRDNIDECTKRIETYERKENIKI